MPDTSDDNDNDDAINDLVIEYSGIFDVLQQELREDAPDPLSFLEDDNIKAMLEMFVAISLNARMEFIKLLFLAEGMEVQSASQMGGHVFDKKDSLKKEKEL